MKTRSNVGVVAETVTLKFTNGYALTFDAGVEIALQVTANEYPRAEILPVPHTHLDDAEYSHCPACNPPQL